MAEDDQEKTLRWRHWAWSNSDRRFAIHTYLEQKTEQGRISSGAAQCFRDLMATACDMTPQELQKPERANAAVLEALLRRHPDLLPDLDQQMRGWPVGGPLMRALEEQSQIRKFLNAQFDLERMTLADERAVLAAGDKELRRVMEKQGITDVRGYRGEIAVEAANKAMKRKIREIRPDLAGEVKKLGFSWER